MILRIKYILKKIKIKFYLIVKNDFKEGMNRRERLFFNFKKIISHPKRFLDSLTGKEDYIDLFDTNISDRQLRRKLYKFFYSYVPYVEACNYCNNATKELKNIPAGQQLKK